jgi:hypothetical protein
MNNLLKLNLIFICVLIGNNSFSQEDSTQLLKEELNIINELYIGDSTYFFEENETVALTEFITIELIDSLTYNAKKENKIDFITRDTSVIRKIDGFLSLPCKNALATFKDNPVEEESIAIHTYVGQLKALNKYIVQSMYWEEYDVKFIDKITGDTSNYFIGIPLLSPSKKNLIVLTANVYSMTTELSFYTVKKNKIKSVFFASFCKWMLAEEGFWSKDGNFYLAVNKTSEFWTTTGDIRKPSYFLKIELKQ